MPVTYTCRCNAYPFPHRAGGGKCTGDNYCPECKAPLTETRYCMTTGESEYRCDECGWRD